MQTLEECPPRQVPVVLDPCREPLPGGLELLAGSAPQDAGHAVPLWPPVALESQKGAAPRRAGVKTAEPVQMRLLRCPLEVERREPLREHPQKPFRILLQAAGPHPSIRRAAQQCLTPTVGLPYRLTPQGQGLMQRHRGADG